MPNYTFDAHVLARISSTGNPFAAILGRPDEANVLLFDIFPGKVYDELLRRKLDKNPYPITIPIAGSEPVAADFEKAARTLFAKGKPLVGFDISPTPQTRSYWNGNYWISKPGAQSYSYNLRIKGQGKDIEYDGSLIPNLIGDQSNVRLSFVLMVQTSK